ncbi:hypothetical protein B0H14DRAFT_3872116 [Mycena olivaceomarginata]|nr:hypothetical protein B0H14DRAFT_3872116 [Mycena olivaceomarginata]
MSRSSILPIFESIVHWMHKSRSSTTSYVKFYTNTQVVWHPQYAPTRGSSQAARDCPIIDGVTLPSLTCSSLASPPAVVTSLTGRDSNGPTPTALLLAPRGLAHHGIIFVPLRCASTLGQLTVPLAAVIYMPVRLEFPIVLYPSLVLRSPSP